MTSQGQQQLKLLLVRVWESSYRRLNHLDGVSGEEFEFILDQLLPKPVVGAYHRAAGLDPGVRLEERERVVFHQVGHAHGGGAADARVAMHQRAALAQLHDVDVIRDGVEENAYGLSGGVSHRYLHVSNVVDERVDDFHRHIDDCRDTVGGEQVPVVSGHGITYVEASG